MIIAIILFFLGESSRNSQPPGPINGNLSRCSAKPNCVCSVYEDDVAHYIDPIAFTRQYEVFDMLILAEPLPAMGGLIQHKNDNYIAAIFSSPILKFVDDLEIKFDPINEIMHFRSASRVGYSDLGVNRNRVEKMKKKIINKQKEANKQGL